jgi:TPR repeat protein
MKFKIIIAPLLTLASFLAVANMDDVQQAFKDKNYQQAFKLLQPIAEQGDVVAQYNLAMMYAEGDGTEVNNEKAAHWYERAASSGHMRAQNNLGLRYHKGNGVTADEYKSLFWFVEASKQGHLPSVFNIASLHSDRVKELLKQQAEE